jgi:hypothetical protein
MCWIWGIGSPSDMILDILRPQRSLQLQSAEWARLIPPDPSFNNTIVVWEITCSGKNIDQKR